MNDRVEAVTNNTLVDSVYSPDLFTLDTVVGDSFFSDIQSKINKKNSKKNLGIFYNRFEMNGKVHDFFKKKFLGMQLTPLMKITSPLINLKH